VRDPEANTKAIYYLEKGEGGGEYEGGKE